MDRWKKKGAYIFFPEEESLLLQPDMVQCPLFN